MLVIDGVETKLAGDRVRLLEGCRMAVNTEVHLWISDDGVGIRKRKYTDVGEGILDASCMPSPGAIMETLCISHGGSGWRLVL